MLKRLVIVNSTPIIALAAIDRIDILKALYGQVIIPKAVHDEIVFKENSIASHALAN
jgi:predicted nucleic acid-binding protein